MRIFLYFFRNKLQVGLQYRIPFLAGMMTQFLWGLMGCLAFQALLESNDVSSPMEYSEIVTYIW